MLICYPRLRLNLNLIMTDASVLDCGIGGGGYYFQKPSGESETDNFYFTIGYAQKVDWFAFLLALIIQSLLFSKGHNFNKSFINFSALFVYLGLIIFLLMVVSEYSLSLSKSF